MASASGTSTLRFELAQIAVSKFLNMQSKMVEQQNDMSLVTSNICMYVGCRGQEMPRALVGMAAPHLLQACYRRKKSQEQRRQALNWRCNLITVTQQHDLSKGLFCSKRRMCRCYYVAHPWAIITTMCQPTATLCSTDAGPTPVPAMSTWRYRRQTATCHTVISPPDMVSRADMRHREREGLLHTHNCRLGERPWSEHHCDTICCGKIISEV